MSRHLTPTMVVVATAAALTLCTAAEAASNPPTAAAWHAVMQCVRSHGYPSLRDPRVNADGKEDFGTQGIAMKRVLGDKRITTACKTYLDKLPPRSGKRPPTPAELHQLVLFAQCIRRHGTPDWPDPAPNGAFRLPPRILNQGKPGFLRMSAACRSVWNNGITIEGPPSGA